MRRISLDAVHLRHHEIGEHEVVVVGLDRSDGGAGRAHRVHPVRVAQQRADQPRDLRFVVDQQDMSRAHRGQLSKLGRQMSSELDNQGTASVLSHGNY